MPINKLFRSKSIVYLFPLILFSFSASQLLHAADSQVTVEGNQNSPDSAKLQISVGDFVDIPSSENPILARVNGIEIRRSEMVSSLVALLRNTDPRMRQLPMERIYTELLNKIVDGKLLVIAAKKEKMDQSPEVLEMVNQYSERVIEQKYLENSVKKADLSDAVLKKRYERYLNEAPAEKEANARHILVQDEKTAKAIIAQLDKGADFQKLAKSKSTDESAKSGGDLGFFSAKEMVPEFSQVAFALKPKTYSKVPVKTQFGYHIIYLEEIRQSKPPSFDEMRTQLVGMIQEDQISMLISELHKNAKIETFSMDGRPVVKP